ncbi:VWA domain-containing protein [uncultured Modestobacter sp.]|uniref:vWA domain-containing protein n=1 Tax=uncultured Modestobacter sp. TaxID=380048 RepID=UPI002625F764|nr:VWA domain-containing protein [uncultured Modestobacter sp.]
MQPLRRKPKQLDEEPSLFQPSSGGGGGLVLRGGDRGRRRDAPQPGSAAPGETEEEGSVVPLDDLQAESEADARTRQRAREIAARLAVPRPQRDRSARRGVGELVSLRYRGGSDELDLDRTLEVLAADPVPAEDDLVVRERLRTRRSVVLVVDVSGSMKGERVRTAAAAVGALAGELGRDSLAVVAFWSDAAVLVPLGAQVQPLEVLDLLLRVPTQGLTNVSFALETAGEQLVGVPQRDARVLLLSDCVHNAGPDPRIAAGRLPRLDVLLDTSGEDDVDLGRDLAQVGRGRVRLVRDHRDVAGALSAVFAD